MSIPDYTSEIPYGYCHCGCGEKTAIAKWADRRHGIIKGEPYNFLHGHSSRLSSEGRIVTFWSHVDKSGGEDACWNWTASTTSGYGRMKWGNRNELAHRISWELAFGELSDTILVLHKCDNPPCCNPHHLFLGTHLDNAADRVQKDRSADFRGEKHPMHKITLQKAIEARRLRFEEGLKYREIAAIIGISRQEVGHIIRGENWKTDQ